jgi:hypothetical protein
MPIRTVANHRGTAKPKLRESCVVGVKIYGIKPNIFRVSKNIISEARRGAHLCPPTFRGKKS